MTLDKMIWATCGIVSVLALQAVINAHNRQAEAEAAPTLRPAAIFTDSRGLNQTTAEAQALCMKLVFIEGMKVATNHPFATGDSPETIYQWCLNARGATI